MSEIDRFRELMTPQGSVCVGRPRLQSQEIHSFCFTHPRHNRDIMRSSNHQAYEDYQFLDLLDHYEEQPVSEKQMERLRTLLQNPESVCVTTLTTLCFGADEHDDPPSTNQARLALAASFCAFSRLHEVDLDHHLLLLLSWAAEGVPSTGGPRLRSVISNPYFWILLTGSNPYLCFTSNRWISMSPSRSKQLANAVSLSFVAGVNDRYYLPSRKADGRRMAGFIPTQARSKKHKSKEQSTPQDRFNLEHVAPSFDQEEMTAHPIHQVTRGWKTDVFWAGTSRR